MKPFDRFSINEKEYSGIGSFTSYSHSIVVNSEDSETLNTFEVLMKSKTKIQYIAFLGERTDSSFSGDFIITHGDRTSFTLTRS